MTSKPKQGKTITTAHPEDGDDSQSRLKYDPVHHPKYARRLAMLTGGTDADLAKLFDVTTKTVQNWRKRFPEFAEAVAMGKTYADANVVHALYKRAIGLRVPKAVVSNYQGNITITTVDEYYPPHVGACMAWLHNRARDHWRIKQEVGPDDEPIDGVEVQTKDASGK